MSTMTEHGIVTQSGSLVFLSGEFSQCPRTDAICVRHSQWPELRGEGKSAREAAKDLLRHLFAQWDWVASNWERQNLERVIAEIQDFLA